MLWWAFAGLSGSIILSLASLALILGLPAEAVASVTLRAVIALVAGGLIVQGCVLYARRPKQKPLSSAEALLRLPVVQATANKPQPPVQTQPRIVKTPGALAALWPARPAQNA